MTLDTGILTHLKADRYCARFGLTNHYVKTRLALALHGDIIGALVPAHEALQGLLEPQFPV